MITRRTVLLTVRAACARTRRNTLVDTPLDAGPVAGYPPMSAIRFPGHGIVVVRDDVGVMALSALCTHQACLLDLAGDGLTCRCHASTFAMDGRVLGGPAKDPLPHFAVTVVADRLRVDPKTIVAPTERLRL